ncbi:hypothetical protein BH10CYA1_BH10CYA1_08230 [soil metagenome]
MKIIVAIDGSQSSEAAVDALTNIQLAPGTEVKLLIAIEPYQDAIAKATDALKGMTDELQKKLIGCTVTYEVAQGDAKSRITEIAKAWSANLIIMGSRGRKGLELMLMGSVSQGVLTQSPCPVIIAKAGETHDPSNGFKNILITVDNSEYSKAALTWLQGIQWGPETQFKIATIVQPLVDSFDSVGSITDATNLTRQHDDLIGMAKGEVAKLSADLAAAVGPKNVSIEVGEGDPKDVIINIATSWSADLIVMGSHGRTGLDKLLLGSVSQAVALHAPCSVAIVRGIIAKGKGQQRQTGMFSMPKING